MAVLSTIAPVKTFIISHNIFSCLLPQAALIQLSKYNQNKLGCKCDHVPLRATCRVTSKLLGLPGKMLQNLSSHSLASSFHLCSQTWNMSCSKQLLAEHSMLHGVLQRDRPSSLCLVQTICPIESMSIIKCMSFYTTEFGVIYITQQHITGTSTFLIYDYPI